MANPDRVRLLGLIRQDARGELPAGALAVHRGTTGPPVADPRCGLCDSLWSC